MGYLEKNFILHRRGEDGNLLPVDIEIKELHGKVSFIPITRGKILDIGEEVKKLTIEGKMSEMFWKKLISKHLVRPKITAEEFDTQLKMLRIDGKLVDMVNLFVVALYEISGCNTDYEKTEKDLKKN